MIRLPRIAWALLACLSFVAGTSHAAAGDPLKVLTTIPDLADIVRAIGGERVDVTCICKGRENTHAVSLKPSHLVAANKADMFVEIGLSLETAFVPGLLENARNPKIQPGQAGFVNCSEGWPALDVPSALSRQSGDVHPQGNPHMNLDPRAGRHIAARVLAGLIAIDAPSKDAHQKRYDEYLAKLALAEKRWASLGAAWKAAKVVVYHQEFNYFASVYGLTIAGSIEDKPGIPPTPNHIAELVALMKKDKVEVILTAVWSNNASVARIAEAGGAKIVELPNMCGGVAGADSWIAMMDLMHQRLGDAFGIAAPAGK